MILVCLCGGFTTPSRAQTVNPIVSMFYVDSSLIFLCGQRDTFLGASKSFASWFGGLMEQGPLQWSQRLGFVESDGKKREDELVLALRRMSL